MLQSFFSTSTTANQVWAEHVLADALGSNALSKRDRVLDNMVAEQVDAIEAALNAMMFSVALKKWDALVLTLGLHGIEASDEGLESWPSVKALAHRIDGLLRVRDSVRFTTGD